MKFDPDLSPPSPPSLSFICYFLKRFPTTGPPPSPVCVVVSPPVVGCSLLPARQLRLLQVREQQSRARRTPAAVEARGVLLHPLRAAGSSVHRRGRLNASLLQTMNKQPTDLVQMGLIIQ